MPGGTGPLSRGSREQELLSTSVRKRTMLPRNIGSQDRPIWVYETVEMTGKRARKIYKYGTLDRRLPQGTRLMPETILKIAKGDRARLNELLKHYGFLI